VQNRFRYAGEQYDQVTGQYYLRARFYNPVVGRFTQEDTYRGDGLNLYSYVQNNPIKYYDPSGYCAEKSNPYKDGNTIDGIEIIDGKVGGKIPVDEFKRLRELSIHNKSSDTITLGKYRPTVNKDGTQDWTIPGPDSYNTLAKKDGHMYFDMGSEYDVTMKKYNLEYKDMFDYFNVPALDDAANAGKAVRFTHNPESPAYKGSFTEMEWKYLQDNHGFTYLKEEGGFWYGQ
jgi:RHS repeat-associated protein